MIVTGTAPNFDLRKLEAGTGILLTPTATSIIIDATTPTTTLASVGVGDSIVDNGTGPNLTVKSLIFMSPGLSATAGANDISIANTSPASSVTLTSAGAIGSDLVQGGSGPALVLRKIIGTSGIGVTQNTDDVTFTNTDPGSAVSLSSVGVGTSIVDDGSGPTLAVKSLTGSGAVTLTDNTTSVNIGVVAVTITSSGAGTSLLNDAVGPAFAVKSVTGSGALTITDNTTSVDFSVTNPTLSSVGAGSTLVQDGTGPTLAVKSIIGSTGVSITNNANDLTITNTDLGSSVTLSNAGAGTSLVSDGTGPSLATNSLSGTTGSVVLTLASSNVTLDLMGLRINGNTTNTATASGTGSLAIGHNASGTGPVASGNQSIAIGGAIGAENGAHAGGLRAVAVGTFAIADGEGAVSFGYCGAISDYAISIGWDSYDTVNTATKSTQIGYSSHCTVPQTTVIGDSLTNSVTKSVLLGQNGVKYLQLDDANAVSQSTSNTTTVSYDSFCGVITMFDVLGAYPAEAAFTFTNARIATTSTILLTTLASDLVLVNLVSQGAGTCVIKVYAWNTATAAPVKIHYLIVNPA